MEASTSTEFASYYDDVSAHNPFGFLNQQDRGPYAFIPDNLFFSTNQVTPMESTSTEFGSTSGWNCNYSKNLFLPKNSIPPVADATSLNNLHQRLLWVERFVLGWELGRKHRLTSTEVDGDGDNNSGQMPLNVRKEFKSARIIAERGHGQGKQYKVLWDGVDLHHFTWLSGTAVKRKGAMILAKWEKQKQVD
ncbi:hypothetical protein B0H13DRAFT_1896265 [Mycena leptocephala]|nr:hypothetical protein B0H13DRAFT_1896265 [Mycena leptocephala]